MFSFLVFLPILTLYFIKEMEELTTQRTTRATQGVTRSHKEPRKNHTENHKSHARTTIYIYKMVLL